MARKSKRKSAKARPRGPAPAPAPPAAPRAPRSSPGGEQALVRSVEMSLPARPQSRRGSRMVLESADPAIPLDRVPYFMSDLARIGIVGALMIVLLFAGSRLIPLVIR